MQNVRDRLAFFYPDSYEVDAVAPTDAAMRSRVKFLMSVQ